jgi:catalase (peroxidase I)
MSSTSKTCSFIALLAVAATPAAALCPFGFGNNANLPTAHPVAPPVEFAPTEPTPAYTAAMHALDIDAVQADLLTLMTDSKSQWPADYGNYGPFFVRLAWHCSDTYRTTDGRGGCSGGRQRFAPEANYEDNANLDKARTLLAPIKQKYGLGLSWGDLFVMAGTTAIQSMGGPTLGVCVGRVDDEDGARSAGLTPSKDGSDGCETDGDCGKPFGATTSGLIYVNPEGPMGKPIPDQSAVQIRDTFARMGMDDYETVALIGGGHSFGKAHGACPKGEGKCGTGKGADTFTSGFEGAWTTNPTGWDNSYFQNLIDYKWEVHMGPGGHSQWRVANTNSPQAPGAQGGRQDIMMLTSDIALLNDPESKYQQITREFATNQGKFDEVFASAWHKLTTRGFGAERQPRCATKRFVSSSSTVEMCSAGPESTPMFMERGILRGAGVGGGASSCVVGYVTGLVNWQTGKCHDGTAPNYQGTTGEACCQSFK